MSHTNSTTNYSLPQFVTTDKPAWLTDINGAFSAIDTGMNNAQTKANTADTNASQALLDASAAGTAASTADTKAAGAIASIANAFDTTSTYDVGDLVMYNSLLYICSVAVTTPGAWTGSTNWTRKTVEDMIPANAGALPLGSDKPAGSTAAAIDAVSKYETASVTPISVTVNSVIKSSITKIGKVVHVEYNFSLKEMTGTIQNKTWGTIPEGFRPSEDTIFTAYYISDYTNQVETKAILISASSAGSITTPNNGANGTLSNPTTNSRIYMSATYIVS